MADPCLGLDRPAILAGAGRTALARPPLEVHLRSKAAGHDLLSLNALAFLDRFVRGEVDLRGNLYLLSDIRNHAKLSVPFWQLVPQLLKSKALLFQGVSRARVNVKSHYDIPQEALNVYLDTVYMSYSCGMFERPDHLDVEELTQVGHGRGDTMIRSRRHSGGSSRTPWISSIRETERRC